MICEICGRDTPAPIRDEEAKEHRNTFLRAKVREELAYAFCVATVLVTKENFDLICKCDRRAWKNAIKRFQAEGAAKCWRELGVE